MNMKSLISIITIAIIASTPIRAEETPEEAKTSATALITAIVDKDHAAFKAQGDEMFSKALTKEIFDDVHAKLAPRIKAGYEMTYLTELTRQGQKVTLWKLTFKDGGDDALATLSMKDGKVSGFFIQ